MFFKNLASEPQIFKLQIGLVFVYLQNRQKPDWQQELVSSKFTSPLKNE